MWFFLTVLVALFTSLKDLAGKRALDAGLGVYLVAWSWPAFSLPFLYAGLVFEPLPALGPLFWPVVTVSALVLVVSSVLYIKAIEASDLSLSVPMLSFTPLFLLGTSPLILGEFPKAGGLCGILLIVVGSYLVHFRGPRRGDHQALLPRVLWQRGPRYMLAVAFLFSIGANIDKIGVRQSSPLVWAVAVNTVVGLALTAVVALKTRGLTGQLRKGWPYLVLIGFFAATATILQMHAILMTLVPYVIAIKRLSVVITSVFGFWLWKEKDVRKRMVGISLMVAGAAVISVFS